MDKRSILFIALYSQTRRSRQQTIIFYNVKSQRKMKFIIQILVIIILGYILELFMPWWSIALAAFSVGFSMKTKANFMAGFLGIALLWLLKSLLIDYTASAPLVDRVASIFTLSKTLLFFVTAIMGGLVGG